MGQIIAILSGKGGVGKTTITALLGAALQKRGHKVLLTDADFGMRDLDLVLGLENEILFDAVDVSNDKSCLEDAIVEISDTLHFLPASQAYRWEDVGRKSYRKLIKKLSKKYDYILIDGPAGIGRGADHLIGFAHRLVIVTQPLWVALRNAGRLVQMCNDERQFDYVVVFNTMTPELEKSMPPQDMLYHIGADYMATLLPFFEQVITASQEGTLHELDDDNYTALLEPLVDYVETGDVWDESDLLTLYEEKTQLLRAHDLIDAMTSASIGSVVAETLPVESPVEVAIGASSVVETPVEEGLAVDKSAVDIVEEKSNLILSPYIFQHQEQVDDIPVTDLINKSNHLLWRRR